MDRGFWRYTRHPNYFGEFCIWWGFWLDRAVGRRLVVRAAARCCMTFLLLRVSGVSLLEKDIGNRRPQYADYVLKTNAFFPGPPRNCLKRALLWADNARREPESVPGNSRHTRDRSGFSAARGSCP